MPNRKSSGRGRLEKDATDLRRQFWGCYDHSHGEDVCLWIDAENTENVNWKKKIQRQEVWTWNSDPPVNRCGNDCFVCKTLLAVLHPSLQCVNTIRRGSNHLKSVWSWETSLYPTILSIYVEHFPLLCYLHFDLKFKVVVRAQSSTSWLGSDILKINSNYQRVTTR